MSRPFIPAPNCVSIELIYYSFVAICENQLHVELAAPASLSDLQAIRAIVNTWDSGNWKNRRAAGVSLARIRTKALDTNTSPVEDFNLPTIRPGTQSNPTCPLNVTFCIKLGTGLTGRSYRGRLYAPGISISSCVNVNTLDATEASALIASLGALNTALQAGSPASHIVVLSYRNNFAWRTTAVPTAVTTFSYADLALDSQRRRLNGRGIA